MKCDEYTDGDHFVMTAALEDCLAKMGEGEESLRFPKEWLQRETWEAIFTAVQGPLNAYAAAWEGAGEVLGRPPRDCRAPLRRWIGDLLYPFSDTSEKYSFITRTWRKQEI